MGKEELNNIKKMYLLRMHTNKKYAIIVFCVAIVIALVDILSMVINFSTDKDVFYLNLNRNSVALFWIVILVLVIKSFNIGEYKNNYMVFPQNSVTRYVSAYLADVTTFGIASLFQVMNQLILFGAVSLVSLFNKNIKLINVFSMKTVFAEFVYLLGYFLLITAIIKLFAVIYRKSMAVFGVITITLIVGALSYRNILQNIAAYAKENNKLFLYEKAIDLVSAIAGFYKREYNMGLFFLKIVVTLVIAFFIGFIIEKKIRDSKSLTFGGNQRAILIRIMAVCGFTMAIAGVTMHYDSNVISKTATEKKTYPLQIKEDDKYPQTISTSYDTSAVGVGNIDISKSKNPRIVIERMELDSKSKNKYIKDVFKDCQISAEVKDGKIQVTSSAKDNKFVYISNMYQENNHVRRFLNKDQTADSIMGTDIENMANSYMTEYFVTLYVPKANIVKDDEDYNMKLFVNGRDMSENLGYFDEE